MRDTVLHVAIRSADARSKKSPAMPGFSLTDNFPIDSFCELGDLMREARDLAARVVLVNDVALRCLHQFWFRTGHGLERRSTVAACDGFLDEADRSAHLGAARFVDDGAAGNLARRLLGGSGIGHGLNFLRQRIFRGWPA